jgi:hypothetical protein
VLFLRSCSWLRNSQPFMEPEGSLPCSQEPSTASDPETDESNSHLQLYFSRIHFALPSHLRLDPTSGLFPAGLPTKRFYVFLITSTRATYTAYLILLELVIPVKSTNYGAPHVVFSSILSLHLSCVRKTCNWTVYEWTESNPHPTPCSCFRYERSERLSDGYLRFVAAYRLM